MRFNSLRPQRLARQLAFAVAILLISGITVSAQSTPCTPDCPGDVWVPADPANLFAFVAAPAPWQSCTMRVQYKQRTACGVYHDIQVVEIEFLGTQCQALRNWLADPSINVAYKANFMRQANNVASVGVIYQEFTALYNSLGGPSYLDCPGGSQIWRAAKGSCWFMDSHNCYDDWRMRSCPNSACCLHEFTICMGPNGPEGKISGQVVPQSPCGAPENPGTCAYFGADGKCYFECDNDGIEDMLPSSPNQGQQPDLSDKPSTKDQAGARLINER